MDDFKQSPWEMLSVDETVGKVEWYTQKSIRKHTKCRIVAAD